MAEGVAGDSHARRAGRGAPVPREHRLALDLSRLRDPAGRQRLYRSQALRYFAELREQPGFQVLRDDGEFNYAALNNAAVAQAQGELVALINNDIEVITPDWLEEMVAIALQPDVGAVGAELLYPDGTVQHAGVVLGIGGIAGTLTSTCRARGRLLQLRARS